MALAAGPDVWEVISTVRHVSGSGERKVCNAARAGVRWLIDAMFPAEVAAELAERGHDARAAVQDLRALTDEQWLDVAVTEERALVAENVVDFVRLLQDRLGHGSDVVPVVFVVKSALPRDAMRLSRALAERLDAWADAHPEPFPTAYWR